MGATRLNAFIGKPEPPEPEDLRSVLGLKYLKLWKDLVAAIESDFDAKGEWYSFSRGKHGWALRVKNRKGRTLTYIIPLAGKGIRVAFVLGRKGAEEAGKLMDLSDAPKYPEGIGVVFEIDSKKQITLARKITAIKAAN